MRNKPYSGMGVFRLLVCGCCLRAHGIRIAGAGLSDYTSGLLSMVPDVVKGLDLETLLPGTSDLSGELESFRNHAAQEDLGREQAREVNMSSARAAFAQFLAEAKEPDLGSDYEDGDASSKKIDQIRQCDKGYLWWENSIGISALLHTSRFTKETVNLNIWTEFQGWQWAKFQCSYGFRVDLNRSKCNKQNTPWHLKSYKWTYAQPKNYCPFLDNEEVLHDPDAANPTFLRSHLSLYFTSGCPGEETWTNPPWQAPWSAGVGLDVRPFCLVAWAAQTAHVLSKVKNPSYFPQETYQPYFPGGGYGRLAYGNALNDERGDTGAFRVIYRSPYFPNFYSWAVIFQGGWGVKPTAWALTLGHRHTKPVFVKEINPMKQIV